MNDKPRQPDSGPAGSQGTMIFRPGDLPELYPPDPESAAAHSKRPRLIGISAPYAERSFPLKGDRTQVGRRANNDIVLDVASVSALHAWLVCERGGCRVINALSTNGTFVNGRKVHEALLADGDQVRFGNVEFRFQAGSGRRRRSGRAWLWLGIGVAVLALIAAARSIL